MAFFDFGPGMQRVHLESTNMAEEDPRHVRMTPQPSARVAAPEALVPSRAVVVATGYLVNFAKAYFGVAEGALAVATVAVESLTAPGSAPISVFSARDSYLVTCPPKAGPASEEFGTCVADALFDALEPAR
jgi:hypothetical protein